MSNFGFFTACWSLFESLVNSSFSFANLSFSSPVDFNSNSNRSRNSPVISVCVSASQKVKHCCFECPRQSPQLTLHLLSQPQRPFRYKKCQFFFSWLLNSKLPLTCIEFVFHVFFLFQGKIDRRWILRRFSPPSQWAEQIRVLSQFTFKLSFRSKRTYSRRIRLALGILFFFFFFNLILFHLLFQSTTITTITIIITKHTCTNLLHT